MGTEYQNSYISLSTAPAHRKFMTQNLLVLIYVITTLPLLLSQQHETSSPWKKLWKIFINKYLFYYCQRTQTKELVCVWMEILWWTKEIPIF